MKKVLLAVFLLCGFSYRPGRVPGFGPSEDPCAGRCSVRRPANALEVGRLAGPVQRARFRMDRSLEVAFFNSPLPRAALLFPLVHRRLERCHEIRRRWTTLIFNSCTI